MGMYHYTFNITLPTVSSMEEMQLCINTTNIKVTPEHQATLYWRGVPARPTPCVQTRMCETRDMI